MAGSGDRADFPRTNAARDQAKKRVRLRALSVPKCTSQGRAPATELGLKVMPLVFELADRFRKTHLGTGAAKLRAIELEAATPRLRVNMEEVRVDERDGVRPGLKSAKLGMMAIAARPPKKHLTGKERFPPERREALRVEVTRMDGPESQGAVLEITAAT
jgi:hypothetical protein